MKTNELIYNVRERLKLSTEDIDISDEYILHLINIERVFFLKQRFSKFSRNVPEEVKQKICVSLEEVNDIENLCDYKVLKSTVKIPSTIEIGGKDSLISIRNNQITGKHLNIVPIERLPYVGYNKWIKNQIYVALDADNYIYMIKTTDVNFLKKVVITGIFANPEEAENLSCDNNNYNNKVCDFYEKEYPVEPYLVSEIIEW